MAATITTMTRAVRDAVERQQIDATAATTIDDIARRNVVLRQRLAAGATFADDADVETLSTRLHGLGPAERALVEQAFNELMNTAKTAIADIAAAAARETSPAALMLGCIDAAEALDRHLAHEDRDDIRAEYCGPDHSPSIAIILTTTSDAPQFAEQRDGAASLAREWLAANGFGGVAHTIKAYGEDQERPS